MGRWTIPSDLHSAIENGPACFFHEHSIGSRDGNIPRYADSCACVRCIAGLTEGRLALDIHKIQRQHRRKFLEFWSLVDLRTADECWEWKGSSHKHYTSGYFHIARHWTRCNTHSAQRVAAWFTWGDIGRLPILPVCKNTRCCNPLHLRVKGVPHFYTGRKLQAIDLEFNSLKLLRQTQEFLEASLTRTPGNFEKLERINAEWIVNRMLGDEGDDEEEEEEEEDSKAPVTIDDEGRLPSIVSDLLA